MKFARRSIQVEALSEKVELVVANDETKQAQTPKSLGLAL